MSRRTPPLDRDAFLAELGDDGVVGLEALSLDASESAPSRSARDRLLAAIRRTHRFDDLEASVAQHLDLPVAAVGPLLLAIDDEGPWERGPRRGIELFHVTGGPKVAHAVTGFVRIETGIDFPEHEHLGEEVVLLLQGACRDADGAVYRAGQEMRMPKGTRHHLTAIGDVRLVYLAVIDEGVIIDGVPVRAGDPRA